MGQRVGANQRQFHQIKKMLKEGISQHQISKVFNIEPQSLEKICAHIQGREERTLAIEENPEMNRMKAENAALRAKLGIEADEEIDDADGNVRIETPESGSDQETESTGTDG